ncbi:MAG: hypothetical protein KAX19_08100, partial [Candidatus Brocadiae bacterium]|nr:hypothetical protein [Candidatus Brocadiia bacterium]
AQKARVRSMPKQKGQEYLDIYHAQKLVSRLERERENADIRSERIDADYEELSVQMRKLEEEIGVRPEGSQPAAQRAAAGEGKTKTPRGMKKMDMGY